MTLTVAEAAALLGVSSEQVYDWIEELALPAQRIRGQYRINRAELLEWSTENGVPVSPQAFRGEQEMSTLAEALLAGGIHAAVPSRDLETALRNIVARLPVTDESDRDMLVEILLAHESGGVAPVGNGIAIPHVRTPIILASGGPVASLAFLDEPIDLDAPDGRAIDTFFVLICPTVRAHLAMLARLAHSLRDGRFRSAVQSRVPEAILAAARALEGSD